jgi:hypothetical protein
MKIPRKEQRSQNGSWPRPEPAVLPAVAVLLLIGLLVVPAPAAAGALAELYKTGSVGLEQTLELGGDDVEDDEAIIFAPAGFAVDSEGYIYIVARKLFCVKKFDSSGDFVLSFGREGEGPGEFRGPSDIVIDNGGRIVVFDFQGRRFQAFTAGGEYLDSWPLQSQVLDIAAAPKGGFYLSTSDFDFMDPEGKNDYMLSYMPGDFSSSTTIDSTRIKFWEHVTTDEGITMSSVPYPPGLHWTVLNNGDLVVGISDRYRLDILSPDYEKKGEIKRDLPPPPLTEADRDEYFASFERDGQSGLSPAMKNKMDFPDHKPYYDDIATDWEGNILVRWGTLVDDVPVYDAFGPDGGFIGRFTLEGVGTGAIFHGGYIYTRHLEEEELPKIRRYAIKGVSPQGSKP